MNTPLPPSVPEIEAFNTYLDALVDGSSHEPTNDLEDVAVQIHELARSVSNRRIVHPPHTDVANVPTSNQRRAREQGEQSYSTWFRRIAAILAIILLGTGWLQAINLSHDDTDLIPFVAMNMAPTPMFISGIPWTQPISPSECPVEKVLHINSTENPAGTLYQFDDYQMVTSERHYEIVGTPDNEDAEEVVQLMRELQACAMYSKTLPVWTVRFEYETRTTAGRMQLQSLAPEREAAATSVSAWYRDTLGLEPSAMWIHQDASLLRLDGFESLVPQDLYNPDNAVLFADGRIGIIPSFVEFSSQTIDSPKPIDSYTSTLTIFTLVDGTWMLDENLQICLGDCSTGP